MKCKHICNAGGYIFAAAGTVAFAYALGALFNAPFWVAALMFIFAAILLLAAFKLWDAAEDGMAIQEAQSYIEKVAEAYSLYGDEDIYDAVTASDDLDALNIDRNKLYVKIEDVDARIRSKEEQVKILSKKLISKYL